MHCKDIFPPRKMCLYSEHGRLGRLILIKYITSPEVHILY